MAGREALMVLKRSAQRFDRCSMSLNDSRQVPSGARMAG